MESPTLDSIASVLQEVTGVGNLQSEQDFYESGVTSVQALPLLMELETRFDISIPDERFIQARTLRSLADMVKELQNA